MQSSLITACLQDYYISSASKLITATKRFVKVNVGVALVCQTLSLSLFDNSGCNHLSKAVITAGFRRLVLNNFSANSSLFETRVD